MSFSVKENIVRKPAHIYMSLCSRSAQSAQGPRANNNLNPLTVRGDMCPAVSLSF